MAARGNGSITAIKNMKVNTASDHSGGTNLNKLVIDGSVKWEKVTASFGGLSGASPSSYTSQIVVANEGVVTSPGSPTKPHYSFTGWSPSLPSTLLDDTLFLATWSIDRHKITYDAGYGTGGTYTYYDYGTPASTVASGAPTSITPGDHRVNTGWTPAWETVTGDKTYTMGSRLEEYTINFDSNGGSVVSSITESYGASISLPTPTTPKPSTAQYSYTFAGWWSSETNNDGTGTQRTWTTMPDVGLDGSSVTLYAKWTPNIRSYKITYDAGYGTGGTYTYYNYGTSAATVEAGAPTITAGDHRVNTGWTPAWETVTGSKTYTMGSRLEKYNINFDENGGSSVSNISNTSYGASISLPTPSTPKPSTAQYSYTFAGWWSSETNNDGTGTQRTWTTMPDVGSDGSSVTLYAKWTPHIISYKVRYLDGIGTGGIEINYNYGTSAATVGSNAPTIVAPTGYNTNGWNEAWEIVTEDKDYYMTFILKTYTITYNAGTGSGGTTQTYNYGTSAATVEAGAPTITPNSHSVWNNVWQPAWETVTRDIEYTAQFDPENYDISFNSNGGGSVSAITDTDYGDSITLPTPSVKSTTAPYTYAFGGWLDLENSKNRLVQGINNYTALNSSYWRGSSPVPVGVSDFDTEIFRYDTSDYQYTLTHDYILDDDLSLLSGQTVTFSVYIRRLDSAEGGRIRVYDNVTGYSYQAINLTTSFQRFQMTKTLGSNPTRIFVMIDETGGGVLEFHSPQLELGSSATTFSKGDPINWTTMPDLGNNNDSITLTAFWIPTIRNYTITYDAGYGTGGTTVSLPWGTSETIVGSNAPTITPGSHRINTGWDSEWIYVQGSKIYTMDSRLEKYNIVFDENGGSSVTNISNVSYDSSISLPTPTTPKPSTTQYSYTFAGWWSDETSGNGSGTQRTWTSMPDLGSDGASVTLYAKWDPHIISYTVTYNAGTGSGGTTQTFGYGTPASVVQSSAPSVTPPSHSVLNYWSPSWSDVTGDEEYVAYYRLEKYNIDFDENGGSSVSNISNTSYGASISLPTPSTPKTPSISTEYFFNGWYKIDPEATSNYTNSLGVAPYTVLDEQYASGTTPTFDSSYEYIKLRFDSVSVIYTNLKFYNAYGECQILFEDGQHTGTYEFIVKASDTGNYFYYSAFELKIPLGIEMYSAPASAPISREWFTTMPDLGSDGSTSLLYAGWYADLRSYTLIWNPNGGTWWDSSTGNKTTNRKYSLPRTVPGLLTKSGHSLSWSGSTTVTGSTTYNAVWTATTYTISFNSEGGTTVSSITQNLGTNIYKPANPTRSGYVFMDWRYSTTGTNGTGSVVSWPINGTSNDIVYARWVPLGLSSAVISEIARSSLPDTWYKQSYDASDYIGLDVRLVIRYKNGSSYQGDIQFDDFKLGDEDWDPENGLHNFERNIIPGSDNPTSSNYNSVVFEKLVGATTNGTFNRDGYGTGSGSTGNTSGHTGSYYYYAESSGSLSYNGYFWLRSPITTLQTSTLEFYSAQLGNNCGPFEVYIDVVESNADTTTETPTINTGTCSVFTDSGGVSLSSNITNNEPVDVKIYAGINTTNFSSTDEKDAEGDETINYTWGPSISYRTNYSYTVYSKAKHPNKALSGYTSKTISTYFCDYV